MIDSEKAAPYATGVLRKGLPIFDRNLKELLKEIQNKAKIACKEAKGSDTEEIARAVNQEVHNWVIGSQEEMTQMIEGLIEVFRLKMSYLPNYEYLFREIEGIKDEKDLAKQYKIFSKIIEKIPIFTIMPNYVIQYIKEIKQKADVIDEKLDIMYDKTVSIETNKVKHPIKSFGKDVTNEIIVSYTAKETVKLVFQLVSMAVLGFPIPTPILNLLSSMVEDL